MPDQPEKSLIPGGLLYEGVGAAPPLPRAKAVERCGSNPFGGQVHDEIVEAIQNWVLSTQVNRTSLNAVHQLRKILTGYPKKQVFETVKANFHGSEREEAKKALRVVGLLK